ncbi:MAG: DUF2125 domain-containing protein [Alphaproteobacteria bacterium]|nr:DUF2125 domain-containing protein [Alphaproteobacteria bacterium]
MAKKFMPFLIKTACAVALAWTCLWFAAAHVSENAVADFALREARAGNTVSYEITGKSGFPWRVTFNLANVTWHNGRGFDLESETLQIGVSPWNWWRFRVTSDKPLTLAAPLLGNAVVIKAHAGSLGFLLDLSDAAAWQPALARGNGLRLELAATALTFPGGGIPGGAIERLALALHFTGGLPRGAAAELGAWRDNGGTIEIESIALERGALRLLADGTIALDRNLQPEGALGSKITGFQEAVDDLVAGGTMDRTLGGVVKGALLLFSKPDKETGMQTVDAPITVQNRSLYIGPIAVLKLPELQWP